MTLHDLAVAVERAQIICTKQKIDHKQVQVSCVSWLNDNDELVMNPTDTNIDTWNFVFKLSENPKK